MFTPSTYSHFIYTWFLESLTSFTSWHTTITLGLSLLATSTGESVGFPSRWAFRRARLFVVAHRCCGPRSRRAREMSEIKASQRDRLTMDDNLRFYRVLHREA